MGADQLSERAQRVCGRIQSLIERHAHAQTELGVVLEQRVGPRRAAPFRVLRPRGRRQIAAVDRGAARGIGNQHPIAVHLGDEFEIGRLAASGASAGELEQRLQQLVVLDLVERDIRALHIRQCLEELPVGAFRAPHLWGVIDHVDGFELRLPLVFDRANLVAKRASRAILRRYLQGVG